VEVVDEKIARSLMKLMESLEDHDDVQNVYANFDIDDDLMEQLSE
jgi:transcriptional/translational regulatory protein YebC/TACO1